MTQGDTSFRKPLSPAISRDGLGRSAIDLVERSRPEAEYEGVEYTGAVNGGPEADMSLIFMESVVTTERPDITEESSVGCLDKPWPSLMLDTKVLSDHDESVVRRRA